MEGGREGREGREAGCKAGTFVYPPLVKFSKPKPRFPDTRFTGILGKLVR